MPKYGTKFSYNGKESDDYDLVIVSFGDSKSSKEIDTGMAVDIISDKLVNSDTLLFYGTEYSDVLKVEVEIAHVNCNHGMYEISNEERREIEKWLFSNKEYAKFAIDDDDMNGTYYNAILNDPKAIMFGDVCVGYKFTLTNDSSFAYGGHKKLSKYNVTDNTSIVINNATDKVGYTYPTIRFQPADGVTSVCFKNLSDNGRECKFEGLLSDEIITLDCKRQILTSSSGISRCSCFNKKFLRLLNGKNTIEITGALQEFTVEFDTQRLAGS